jgi:Na+/proline symporter
MSDAIPYLVPCGIIAVASVPLMLGVVPPNNFYGFRTRRTLANTELWFRANRFAGVALFIAALTSASVFLAMPEYASGRSLAGLFILITPLIAAVGLSFAYVQRSGT